MRRVGGTGLGAAREMPRGVVQGWWDGLEVRYGGWVLLLMARGVTSR